MSINGLRIHYGFVTLLYTVAFYIAYGLLSLPKNQTNLIMLLSSGAILATFGSAIGAIGLIWQTDLHERIRLNIDILCRDILKQNDTWRRWPFLPRYTKRTLLNGGYLSATLNNPKVTFDVGSHLLEIHRPTVMEDYFDLPLLVNICPLLRFRKLAHTFLSRKQKDKKNPETGLTPPDEYVAYECMLDIWMAIFKFRISRYVIHFGSSVTIAGAGVTVLYVLKYV